MQAISGCCTAPWNSRCGTDSEECFQRRPAARSAKALCRGLAGCMAATWRASPCTGRLNAPQMPAGCCAWSGQLWASRSQGIWCFNRPPRWLGYRQQSAARCKHYSRTQPHRHRQASGRSSSHKAGSDSPQLGSSGCPCLRGRPSGWDLTLWQLGHLWQTGNGVSCREGRLPSMVELVYAAHHFELNSWH
jgi:hypothetical protein